MESEAYIQMYFGKCDCSCHDSGYRIVKHIMPCCTTCEYCGMNVEKGRAHYHYEKFHKKSPVQEAEEILNEE